MNALEFLRRPRQDGPKPIYAVFGEDAYLRREALSAIARAAFGEGEEIEVDRFPGDKTPLADVLDELRTLPFLASRRVALVEEADGFVSKHRKELEDYAERPSSTGTLILSVKSWPGNTKLAKKVDQVGLAIDCKPPQDRDLAPWLVGLAKLEGVKLDDEAARLMVELVGASPGLLASDIEKLVTYVGPRKRIARDDVAKMVGAGRIEKIFKILDSATTGNAAEALDDLDRLLVSGEPPVKLLAGINVSLQKVHQAGALRLARRDLKEACREAGIPPFAVEKTGKQHAHLGPTRTARIPATLLQADLDLKGSSSLPPRVVLEKLIVELARPRRD